MTTDFEQGRQDALLELEVTISRRLKFTESVLDEDENMTYSKEHRKGIFNTYKEILNDITLLKDKERLKNMIA